MPDCDDVPAEVRELICELERVCESAAISCDRGNGRAAERDALDARAALLAAIAPAFRDAKRLDWLERRLTLHKGIEWLYIVDGYEVSTTYDGNTEQSYAGTTLRAAIDAAIAAEEGTK